MSDERLRWVLGLRHPGHDYKIFKTQFVDATHESGRAIKFSLIEAVDWVNVVAITPDEQVVLIKQYRPGIEKVCLEIPGGMVDPGEDAEGAARRELVEETGYTAKTWRHIGRVSPNPAIQTNYLHSYLAVGAERTHEPKLDGNEVVSVSTLPLRDVTELLRRGAIEHALVVTAFAHLAFALGDLRLP